jgi:SNF2 family DNA or RNA helicase
MQHGGNDICWFGLIDQPEIHTQFNARLWRQGQESGQVRIHYLLARRTVDEAVWERINDKDASQAALLRAMKSYQSRVEGGVAA